MHQGFPSHLSSLATAAASWQLSTIFSTSANFGLRPVSKMATDGTAWLQQHLFESFLYVFQGW